MLGGFVLSPVSVPDDDWTIYEDVFVPRDELGSPRVEDPPPEQEEDPNISDSDDSFSSSDSSVDDEAEQVFPRARPLTVAIPEARKLYRCIKSGLLHACITESELKLACGKPISKSYKSKQVHETSKDLKCIPCFAKVSALQDSL